VPDQSQSVRDMVFGGPRAAMRDAAPASTSVGTEADDFCSILFPNDCAEVPDEGRAPDHFRDLNLDQITRAITDGRESYTLLPFFYAPAPDVATIEYRQAVMRDVERPPIRVALEAFAAGMQTLNSIFERARRAYYEHERSRLLLAAAQTYVRSVTELEHALSVSQDATSCGMRRLRAHLRHVVASERFGAFAADTRRTAADLAAIRYGLLLKDDRVGVRSYPREAEQSPEAVATFAALSGAPDADAIAPGAVSDVAVNHIQAQILDRLALLYPGPFAALAAFRERHAEFVDASIRRFTREIQFYLAYAEYIERFRRAGLSFCYPRVSAAKEIRCRAAFDAALAGTLIAEHRPIVCNDIDLHGSERIVVVSGPNQGGKTTFARMFGQLHFLASLGCPVPGTEAHVHFCDGIVTHFERVEHATSLRGKLKDDLIRIRGMLNASSPRTIIILNEIFSSTTARDALFLSTRVLQRIAAVDALAVCVTFLTELASLNEKTVSVVAAMDACGTDERTFRLERKAPDGRAFALAIARKYGLTYAGLRQRISRP